MPRTKQIHPRNLRDKIEEAQKKLNSPEEPQKEIVAVGSRSCFDTVKGVKRKKIVTENHLKKIPKSPLRNISKEKQKHDIEVCTSQSAAPSGSSHSKSKEPFLHNQNTKEGKGTSAGLNNRPVKSGISMQARKLSIPPDLCNGRSENFNFGSKMTLIKESSTAGSIPVNMKSANITSENINKQYLSENSAFDVLLKAMEPELNSLNQSRAPCGTQTEKQGHKSEAPLVTHSSSTPSSERETSASYFHHHRTAELDQSCTSAKSSPHTQVHSGGEEEFQKQQPPTCHNYSSVVDVTKRQVYHIAVTSSVVNTSPVTQVLSLPGSSSIANSSNISLNNTYSVTQVASRITGEQMCNIVLKDQKPKKQGKYICEYCNRACAKPSVLLKHIRSHTGERPYPCVTCGFSFKTKSNLYKHKKSHAHAIKLGLGVRTETGGMLLSQDSEKALFIGSDVDDSGESDEEYTSEERQEDQNLPCVEFPESVKMSSESLKEGRSSSNSPVAMLQDNILQEKQTEVKPAELPKVVVYPVSVSPLRADSPKVLECTNEQFIAQMPDLKIQNKTPNVLQMCSLSQVEQSSHKMCKLIQDESKQPTSINAHAQLQRQQATDCSQDQQSKCLLSPRSLGSTDSGYFSRSGSESADQAMISPSPFIKRLPSSEKDFSKNVSTMTHTHVTGAVLVQPCIENPPVVTGIMRPPMGTKTLEERISKLISDNEAVVDDKQLDSVKPRRTSLSRRGSIDSPKSYIFKDSFQFDLKPAGRRTSSSSDIPKSPFTPTEKSKQVFFLSVPSQYPSIDCLPITRSNSMPTTGYSAIPPVIPASHPLRGSQSFDDKIGSLCDDVFVSGPSTPQHTVHPRTLVRQAAVEDSATEHCGLGPARSVDESYPTSKSIQDVMLPRSKSFVQGTSLDKIKKSHQGRGTMFECETCRNRYRKLENFENHKKFYCSELHGPKSKTAARETDHSVPSNYSQSQMFHYRVANNTGTLEQPLPIRKRRKMKSVGDDDEPQPSECRSVPENMEAPSLPSVKASSTITILGSQSCSVSMLNQQIQLVSRCTEPKTNVQVSAMEKNNNLVLKENVELKCQGTGISVIQHTNSLSRPSSFEKSESVERVSPGPLSEIQKSNVKSPLNAVGIIQEERTTVTSQISTSGSLDVSKPDDTNDHHAVLAERTGASQSRLVRQHNIQVPEILVTEEPDKDPEIQTNDPELQEKFTWPQRSGSLSSLPTEKLPPKKKRIRLADLDNSSAESSFESTISRSLSRESSLSRTSSFSASFEKDESSKSESFSKTESINKSSEFLTIPTGLNAFGTPREMRRAASEQINCTQSSMEVTDYRSKSFDCGSMSRSRSMSPINIMTSRSSLVCSASSGHVPLLERRRGPLVKQISLNISERSVSPGKSNVTLSENPALTQQNVHNINRTLTEVSVCSKENSRHTHVIDQQLADKSKLAKVQLSDSRCSVSSLKTDFPTGMQNTTKGDNKEKNVLPHKKYECKPNFTPKYQLECPKPQERQFCSIKPVTIILPNSPSRESGIASQNLKAAVTDGLSNICPTVQKQNKLYCNYQSSQSVVVPVHNYSSSLYYGFSAVTSVPEILVTQDQGNPIVCKVSSTLVAETVDLMYMPKSQEEHSRALAGSVRNFENCLPPSVPQKVPLAGLVPQQETSASSKRMLSPANSLDIAMEKQQKRVKDESGAACNTNSQQVHLLSMKAAEPVKPRKPTLVRQFCTTDPGESLDSDISQMRSSPENHSPGGQLTKFHSSPKSVSDGKEIEEYEQVKSIEAVPTVRMSPEPFPLSTQTSSLKSSYSSQERRSPVTSKAIHIQGQVKLTAAISSVNAGDMHRLSFPSLKTSTSFTWCYLLKRKPIHLSQTDQKTSAYASWTISSNNPNPLGLPTKVALSLLNSKQKGEKFIFTLVKNSHQKHDVLVYSSKWKSNSKKSPHHKPCNLLDGQKSVDTSTEQDKEPFQNRSEPRRVKIFDGGYKSNEEYVYVRGRGRGKYICEECGIRCKKPSMLKKHIRTHTDVRPYHCNYCNFSFKTKGNLTKHMKSKAHSKKCMDMGIAVGPVDDQDTDDSGERQRYTGERSGFDGDDSDGAEDDDNDNEDEDEDSQAESVLSATPSVTASPQHYPFRNSQQEASSADEDGRVSNTLSQANSMDILPKALITRMTALTTSTTCKPAGHKERGDEVLQNAVPPQSETSSSKSLCHQMSIDYPATDVGLDGAVRSKSLNGSHDSVTVNTPSSPVDQSTQTMDSSVTDSNSSQSKPVDMAQRPAQISTAPTHLFSHLPLHSQQPVRSPYSMIPVGGIQLVPAGLTAYSTFVPFPTGQVQLTIPAVGVIHRTANAHSDKPAEVPSTPSPIGVAEVNSVVPCIPIGQVNVPGLSASGLQSIQPLSMETVNILGLSNPGITPQIHPSGLTLNAVGLQVLTTSPGSQRNPSPQAHIPGLQILNIALPTLIPSISPLSVDAQGHPDKSPSCSTAPCQGLANIPGADAKNMRQSESQQVSSRIQESPKASGEAPGIEERATTCGTSTERDSQLKQSPNISTSQSKTSARPDLSLKVHSQPPNRSSVGHALPPLRHQRRTELISRQSTVQFSDSSSDDDEGRLVIAT
ncbi:zinc finger protein 40 isoform X2 [Bufo gargarizans]|uniref:zinc finger protein 40 isoform X2 n=1 Tax=Bufo gargarizans TaxID=30331 RepID=UPI001CF56211|nr:zinc finger protein 40 isoform X2 [Bufo gargarizans]XP_044148875.1 zinc finger protein 40 isoform X2 [Bufo gargarizans]XP_044148876.1 zinc finger protein 40 isoform X2 [Bufo gargarizans]